MKEEWDMQTILVCDDDREIVDAISIYLGGEGFRIVKAYDGQEALDLMEKEPVDLNHPLFGLENYICTPHTAAESYENYAETGLVTAKQVVAMIT